MSLSYSELLAIMETNQDPPEGALMGSGEETRAMKVVRAGMGLHGEEDTTEFWDNFMSLCSDSEGMADLLGVSAVDVRRWANRIRENIERVKENNSSNPEGEDNSEVLPTGDNDGALSFN